uniref:Uncharacterized protein n=1 Tax=Klebsiella phage FKP3 TaxID=3231233 RepID=A0AAU8HZH8_9CAUD
MREISSKVQILDPSPNFIIDDLISPYPGLVKTYKWKQVEKKLASTTTVCSGFELR